MCLLKRRLGLQAAVLLLNCSSLLMFFVSVSQARFLPLYSLVDTTNRSIGHGDIS